jgi:hypothetical protein
MVERRGTSITQLFLSTCVLAISAISAACPSKQPEPNPPDKTPVNQPVAQRPWCGPKSTNQGQSGYSGNECVGQLPPRWDTLPAPVFAGIVGPRLYEIGFGRTRPREPEGGPLNAKVLTFVGPTEDAHTLRPDKITDDVVFGVMIVTGTVGTKKFKMQPKNLSTFWMILHPNPANKDSASWRLEHVYSEGGNWKRQTVFSDGIWKTCPRSHAPLPFSYADFSPCPTGILHDSLSSDITVTRFLELTRQAAPSLTAKAATTFAEAPVWIFCDLGCCYADRPD